MLDRIISERIRILINVQFDERRNVFLLELSRLKREAAGAGSYRSGNTITKLCDLHSSEISSRAIIAWQSVVRAHQIFGVPLSADLRTDLKNELHQYITQASNELKSSLINEVQSLHLGDNSARAGSAIEEAINHNRRKHDIEIDLYVDSLERRTQQAPVPQQYNFYGNIGAVQTGANASANVVQNLGGDDKTALIEALALAREAIRNASELGDTRQTEMIAIANECEEQVNSVQPNNTKLLTLLTVLGTTVQSIASAPAAYNAMKTALLPLGVNLP